MQGSIFKRVQHVCEKAKPRWVRLPNPTPRSFPCPECGANLTKEKRTRYDCFWRTNGKLRSKTVATKHDATRFLATVVTETHNGTYQQTRPVTMNAVFDEWEKHLDVKLQQGRLKPSTKKAYLSMLRKHLRPNFGSCRSDQLSEHVCTAPGFLDSGLTVFASTPPRPARGGRVAPGPGFGSRISPASTVRCMSA